MFISFIDISVYAFILTTARYMYYYYIDAF